VEWHPRVPYRRSYPSFCEGKKVDVTRFNKIRKSSELKRIKERMDAASTHLECVGGRTRVEYDIIWPQKKYQDTDRG